MTGAFALTRCHRHLSGRGGHIIAGYRRFAPLSLLQSQGGITSIDSPWIEVGERASSGPEDASLTDVNARAYESFARDPGVIAYRDGRDLELKQLIVNIMRSTAKDCALRNDDARAYTDQAHIIAVDTWTEHRMRSEFEVPRKPDLRGRSYRCPGMHPCSEQAQKLDPPRAERRGSPRRQTGPDSFPQNSIEPLGKRETRPTSSRPFKGNIDRLHGCTTIEAPAAASCPV